jgi:hypothetical protein
MHTKQILKDLGMSISDVLINYTIYIHYSWGILNICIDVNRVVDLSVQSFSCSCLNIH